jgi:hypothetical protein
LVAHEVIARLDAAQESRALSVDEQSLRKGLKRRLLGLASLERTIARQRARVVGLKEGDANAQFFLIYAAKRSRRNIITCLRDGDRVASDQAALEELATDFYVNLLGKAQPRHHDISLCFLGLPTVDLAGLDAQFGNDEVWIAVKSLSADKSPGPDGFSWSFQSCWTTVKHDVLAPIRAVHSGQDLFF